jgi:hypothetical protein
VGVLCEADVAERLVVEHLEDGELIVLLMKPSGEDDVDLKVQTWVSLGDPSRGGVSPRSSVDMHLVDLFGCTLVGENLRIESRGLFADPIRGQSKGYDCDVVFLGLDQKGSELAVFKVFSSFHEFGDKRVLCDELARLVIEGLPDVEEEP